MDPIDHVIEIANLLIDNERLEEAVTHLNSAIEQYPGRPELFELRGIAFFRLLKIDESITDFETAIAMDSGYHRAFFHLAQVAVQKHEFEVAESFLYQALALEPENYFYQINLAYVKLESRNYEACIVLCHRILDKYPSDLSAIEYRALSQMQLKRYQEAAPGYEFVCLNSADNAVLYNNTGYCYSKIENIDKAKFYLSRAIRILPSFAYAYNNLGYVFYLEKNFRKAHELIDKSLELDPSNSYAYKNKALVCLAEGDRTKARTNLEKAAALKFDLLYGDEVNNLLSEI
jgi:Flp pilus assembly protein TadD